MRHASRPSRRNPRARPAPKNPTVVLVRRFDPSGEDLPRWDVLVRDEDGRPEFFSQTAAKKAALNPPTTGDGADLHIGDLIATMPAEAAGYDEHATGLYVVTPDGVKAAPVPGEELSGPWLTSWGQDAYDMLLASSGVKRHRLAMAACDCAEAVLHLVPAGEDLPQKAIGTARAWCRGEASIDDVRDAADAAASYAADARVSAFAAAASVSSDTAYVAAAHAAIYAAKANGAPREATYRDLAPLVERWIPLPVVLLARLGYPDAVPFDPSMVPVGPRG